jgi:hypothetical protein
MQPLERTLQSKAQNGNGSGLPRHLHSIVRAVVRPGAFAFISGDVLPVQGEVPLGLELVAPGPSCAVPGPACP